jgi:cytochrome c oxidase subunit 4
MSEISLTRSWLILLLITCVTYWIGEGGLAGHGSMVAVLIIFALAFIKGLLVCLDFLELRHAPALWRWIVMGWLVVVVNLVVLAYAISLRQGIS